MAASLESQILTLEADLMGIELDPYAVASKKAPKAVGYMGTSDNELANEINDNIKKAGCSVVKSMGTVTWPNIGKCMQELVVPVKKERPKCTIPLADVTASLSKLSIATPTQQAGAEKGVAGAVERVNKSLETCLVPFSKKA